MLSKEDRGLIKMFEFKKRC